MSRTRQLMRGLRDALGSSDPLPPAPAVPAIPPPPARVYTPRPERSPFAARAAAHTTALVGIGHVGTRYATDVVLQFQAELAVAHAAGLDVFNAGALGKLQSRKFLAGLAQLHFVARDQFIEMPQHFAGAVGVLDDLLGFAGLSLEHQLDAFQQVHVRP